MKVKVQFSVSFPKCGAESHPGFSTAIRQSNGNYLISYPIHNKDLLKSKKAQREWAEQKQKHLRSWGVIGVITYREL